MGVQQYSEKNVRKLSRLCGVELGMVWSSQGGGLWREARTAETPHRHVLVNVKTGEMEDDPEARHMTSCLDLP